MGDLSAHLSRSEFACKCGCGFDDVKPDLIEALEALRAILNVPVHLDCGCRCPKHNAEVGGERDSFHMKGMAAHVTVRGMKVYALYTTAQKVERFANGGIGYYPQRGFVHVDVRHGMARWMDTGKR
jgi:uncharacterized protein YcbK (DUF882 family)